VIYTDALTATANGNTNTVLLDESLSVIELVLVGASSTLVTTKIYHSVGGRVFRQIATLTVSPDHPTVDMHVISLWPPGLYYALISGLVDGDKAFISFAGE